MLGGIALAACGDDDGSTTANGPAEGSGGNGGGGGTGATATPVAQSGTRLRRRDRVAGDTRQFQNWYDASLETDCRFRQVSDNTWRCVPSPGLIRRFLDAECTEAVAVRGSCSAASFGLVDASDGCAPIEFEVFRAGAPLDEPAAVYAAQADGSCTELPEAARTGSEFFEFTPVAPDALITVVPEIEDRGGDLGVRTFTTAGGAAGIIELVDLRRDGVRCNVLDFSDIEFPICLPDAAPIVGGGVFGDAGCAGVEVAINGPCIGATPPPLVLQVATNGCDGSTTTLHEPGAQTTTVFSGSPGSCSPLELNGRGAYEVGLELEPGAVRTLARQLRGAEVQVLGAVDEGGSVVAELTNNAFDAEGNRCFTLTAEGGFRCLPESTMIYEASIFADAACEEILVPTDIESCAGPPSVYALEPDPPDDICGSSFVEQLHAPGEPFEGPDVYSLVNDVCTAAPRGEDRFVRLGTPLSVSSFPLVRTNVLE
ncbi:MAG: hypothetical protein AAGA56_10590 [Myxococcota bacterium]